jgi:hypothetical protein
MFEIVPIPEGASSWPVDDPDLDREVWVPVTVFGVDIAVEVRSSHPLTTAAMRETANQLMEIADDLEAEMAAL